MWEYPYPSLSGRWQVSSNGGTRGEWLQGGRAIVYRAPDQRLVRVDVEAIGESFQIGEANAIFAKRAVPDVGVLAPDGKRLLVAVPQGGSALTLHLVTDWRSLLEKR